MIAETCLEAGCLLLASVRPGTEMPWQSLRRAARLVLEPLSAVDARRLLEQLPEGTALGTQKAERILKRADGNPFFIVELVRASAAGDEQVPGDVFAVLNARIDRLDADAKQDLRLASVIGREFPLELVERIRAPASMWRPSIDLLCELGFVKPAVRNGYYQFVHALTCEAAYGAMLAAERRRWHGVVAECLEASTSRDNEDCIEIARHYLASTHTGRALPWLEQAVARAIERHTLDAAYGYVQAALELDVAGPATQARARVLVTASPVFHFLSRHAEYDTLLESCADEIEAHAEPTLLGPFLLRRGHRLWTAGRYAEAQPALERAAAVCSTVGALESTASAHTVLCWLHANRGDNGRGARHGAQALALIEHSREPDRVTMTRVGLLLGAAYRSRWDEARQHGECARAAAQTCRDDGMGSFGGAFLGWVLAEMGELEAALAVGAAAVDCAPTVHFKGWATAFHDATRCRTDDAGTALPALTEATRAIEVSGHASGHALIALLLAEARVRNQRYDELLPETLALRTAALRMPYPWVAAGALGVLAERELATGAREDAAHSFQQAAREYSSIGAVDRATRASDRAMAAASGDGLGRLGHIGSGVSG